MNSFGVRMQSSSCSNCSRAIDFYAGLDASRKHVVSDMVEQIVGAPPVREEGTT